MTITPALDQSNSLADLAARIRSEHDAAALALKRSVGHAMAAGDLLLEAKAQVPHGRWLNWFADNCDGISERTAQLYMKLAKNRATIETEMRNPQSVADLTLNEAAALCVLAGRLNRLMEFAKRVEAGDPEGLISLCIKEGFGVVRDPGYDPFASCDEAGKHDWCAFVLFLVRCCSWSLDGAAPHVEYLLQKQFKHPDEWLGEEGYKFRRGWCGDPSEHFKTDWAKYLATQADRTTAEIEAELSNIRAEEIHREAAP